MEAKEELVKARVSEELSVWLSTHKLEIVELISGPEPNTNPSSSIHLRVRREGDRSSSRQSVASTPAAAAPVAATPGGPSNAASGSRRTSKVGKPTRRSPAKTTAAKKKGGHPTVEEEQAAAEEQAQALERRLTSRPEAESADDHDDVETELQPVGPYRQKAKALRAQIDEAQAAISREWETLALVIGVAIIKKKMKAKELVAAWDKKGKGEVSKVEFRQGVQQSLAIKADRRAVDEVFDSFDDDGGGTLDAAELREALDTLKANVSLLKAREANLHEAQVPTPAPPTHGLTAFTPRTVFTRRRIGFTPRLSCAGADEGAARADRGGAAGDPGGACGMHVAWVRACMACAWHVHGMCLACAWRVHGVCMRVGEAHVCARACACLARAPCTGHAPNALCMARAHAQHARACRPRAGTDGSQVGE